MNKKHISLLFATATLAFSSALWLANRREIIDITSLMASLHSASAEQAPTQEPSAKQKEGTGKPGSIATTFVPQAGKNRTTADTPTQDMGTIITEKTEVISPPGYDGVVRRSKVTIPDEALNWAKPGHYPKVGDLLRISVPIDHEYIIEVLSFEIQPNGKDLIVLGDIHGGRGRVSLMLYEDHFSLLMTDEEQQRTYNIFYDVRQNYYSVEEIDTSLLTPKPGFPPSHKIDEESFFSELEGGEDMTAPEPTPGS